MNKGERISRFVGDLVGTGAGDASGGVIADHPYYRAYFQCWNEQRNYEEHDVLEQVWLNTDTADDEFFKGLIQAAGAFVHLQKDFQHPTHAKHGQRLKPAVRLFALAEKNLTPFAPVKHALDVGALIDLLRATRQKIEDSDFQANPWSPDRAPKLSLL